MDLLCSYDDEASNTTDQQKSGSMSVTMPASLQSEWESFEKSLENSDPVQPGGINSQSETHQPPSSASQSDNSASMNHLQETKKFLMSSVNEEEEDDESHLPPGVRKKNRCHNSSSSSSEDEDIKKEEKDESDSDMSDSDDSVKGGATKEEKKEEEKPKSKRETVESLSKKTRRSRSSSGSRSRSRSPHRKRRKSSERSRHSRSRSRGRHHKKERKHSSRHSRSKDRRRSKERDHRHRRRESRTSRSRSRERRDGRRDRRSSRDRSHRNKSRERERDRERRNKSPSPRRNRSPSPRGGRVIKYGDKVIKAGASFGRPPPSKPMTFKEKMRQQLIKAMEEGGDVSSALTSKDGVVICTQTAGTQQVPAPKKPPVPLMSNLVTSTANLAASTITPSEAAMQSMLALQKETTEKTGVEIPKYYNPAAINPVKYAEQVQKRKLLWSKTKEKDVNSQWHATSLSGEHDDKSKEKFRKLMGIKDSESDDKTDEQEIKQKELFDKLDKEYQYARMATHTHRGIGLGFGSASSYQPPTSTS